MRAQHCELVWRCTAGVRGLCTSATCSLAFHACTKRRKAADAVARDCSDVVGVSITATRRSWHGTAIYWVNCDACCDVAVSSVGVGGVGAAAGALTYGGLANEAVDKLSQPHTAVSYHDFTLAWRCLSLIVIDRLIAGCGRM